MVNTNCHLALCKFQVPSLSRFGDGEVPTLQKWVTWPHLTPFDLILHFFREYSLPSISVPNLKFPALTVPEILGGSQNFKSRSRDAHMTPVDLILHFFISTHCLPSLWQNLKFLSLTLPEILGGPKIPKVDHVTPHDAFWPNFAFFH